MTLFKRKEIYIYELIILATSTVVNCDPYCEFNLCQLDQYCCDDNTCCTISNPLYIVLTVVAVVIILAIIGYLLVRCLRRCTGRIFIKSTSEERLLVNKV